MMDVKGIIKSSLNIPVIEPFEPIVYPCATFYAVNDGIGLTGDGEETEGVENYQIDVWDRGKMSVKEKGRKLRADLRAADSRMTIPDISYMYDNNGKVWRATLTFSVVREEQ